MSNTRYRAQRLLYRAIREPLLHFLLLGSVIFATAHIWNSDSSRYRIIVGPEQVGRLIDTYRRQYGRPPERAQLQALIDQDIREEILYREGMALDLAKEDPIVRRRVAQKFEFLQLDLGSDPNTDKRELEAYYQAHLAEYLTPAKVSFTQVFLSAADGRDPVARARKLRDDLQRSGAVRAAAAGDSFAGPSDYASLDKDSLSRVFGESPIVGALLTTPEHAWAGPFRSAYGWHLIYVTSREPEKQLVFGDIRERVLADYQETARKADVSAAFARLRSKYVIVRDHASPG
jgi:peptidyl-prolyl cis-trans isomerase C